VAGAETAGFLDGSFTQARFNTPMGLAICPDSSKLYVADSGNNRIRVIHLDADNRVDTLAGQDSAGKQNGPLSHALFNQPRSVVYLPGDLLAVNDFGNKLIRLIDLKSGIVTTLAGGAHADLSEGPASQVSMANIRDMAYLPAADSLFVTDTETGTVRRLDLKTRKVTQIPPVMKANGPTAVCAVDNRLYVGLWESRGVLGLSWKEDSPVTLTPCLTASDPVFSLAETKGYLYAFQKSFSFPFSRLLPANLAQPLTFVSVWGDQVPEPGSNLYPFSNIMSNQPGGLVCDPNNERKLYFSNPRLNAVLSYRDLYGNPRAGGEWANSNGLNESEYPLTKPAKTFRILLVGDSRSSVVDTYPFTRTMATHGEESGYPRVLSLTKRTELELNTLGALDNQPLNFEVLNRYFPADQPLFLWPTNIIPDLAKKNDIDLVVILQPPTISTVYPYLYYFWSPLTADGIPTYPLDMEYYLKPPEKRIPAGEAREFYNLCKSKHLVTTKDNNFIFDDSLFLNPEFHDVLVRIYGKPLDLLKKKIDLIKTSGGQPVKLLLCTTHTGILRPNPEDPGICGMESARNTAYPIWIRTTK
jgi:hypothetical protein